MIKSKVYNTGMWSVSKVEVTNRQNCVEYKILKGYCDESDIRSHVGNDWKSLYAYDYDGYYHNRKECIERLQSDIDNTKQQLEDLEFALKVTKKKNWVKVE